MISNKKSILPNRLRLPFTKLWRITRMFILTGLLLGPVGIFGQFSDHQLNLATYDLKGNVKSVNQKVTSAKLVNGNIVLGRATFYRPQEEASSEGAIFQVFDEQGNQIMHQSFTLEGLIFETVNFKYDSHGKVIKGEQNVMNRKNAEEETFGYDKKGRLIWKKNYFYNPKRDYFISKNQYDSAGNWISCKKYDSKGDLKIDLSQKFNADSKVVLFQSDSVIGSSLIQVQYQYDAKGNRVELKAFENGKLIRTISSTYDDSGRAIREETRKGDNLVSLIYEKEYDENGNITRLQGSGSDLPHKTDDRTEITYDLQGNWTKKVISDYRGPKFIITREIIYF